MITVTVLGVDRLLRTVHDPQLVLGPAQRLVNRLGLLIESRAKERAPVDTKNLRASIRVAYMPLRAIIAPHVYYAPFVEFGTRPHMPPVNALQPWARRHGVASAWALAMHIARFGTRAHPFMVPAAQVPQADLDHIVGRFRKEVAEGWQSHA